MFLEDKNYWFIYFIQHRRKPYAFHFSNPWVFIRAESGWQATHPLHAFYISWDFEKVMSARMIERYEKWVVDDDIIHEAMGAQIR